MTARNRPQYRYIPRRRGYRGLGDDSLTFDAPVDTTVPISSAPTGIVQQWFDPTQGITVGMNANGQTFNMQTGVPVFSSAGTPADVGTPSSTWTPTPVSGASSPTSTTQNWAAVLNTVVANAGKIIQQDTNPLFNLAPGTYAQVGPGGTVVSTAGIPTSNPLASLTSSSMMPILLLGGGALLLFAMMGKK